MMLKNSLLILLASSVLFTNYATYKGSTAAAVAIAGGVIKSKSVVDIKKYPRSKCPVCKGKGWYISGDKIKRVDCGYCEPDQQTQIIKK